MNPQGLVERLPYPLSSRYGRLLDGLSRLRSGEPVPRLAFDLCAAAGILIRFDAAIAIVSYVRDTGASDPVLNHLVVDKLRAPSDGAWLEVAERLAKAHADNPAAPLARRLNAALRPRNTRRGKRPKAALLELIGLRNRLVHGHVLDRAEIERGAELLAAALAAHAFFGDFELRARVGDRVWTLHGSRPGAVLSGDALDALADGEPTLVSRDGSVSLSLAPLLHFVADAPELVGFDELFFLNSGTAERLSYIAYRYAGQLDGEALGTYADFRRFLARLPTPPIPASPRLDFDDVAAFHERLFVGREEVFAELERFVAERPAPYGLLEATAGMGKTAIFARLYDRYAARAGQPSEAGDRWVFHFCSTVGGRDAPVVALRSLIAQTCDLFGLDSRPHLATDVVVLQERFASLLRLVSERLAEGERLVVAIDAVDEGIPTVGESVGGVLPSTPPVNVLFVLSYRVGADGTNAKVDEQLAHLPSDARRRLDTASPLGGLTREDVAELLVRATGAERLPPAALEAVWAAATRDTTAADPFYLRLVADGLEDGRFDATRPESLPTSLHAAFKGIWRALPTDGGFALHRLIGFLAIMRDSGDDALFADLLGPHMVPERVTELRPAIGKLLVYDGDRYGLFHDRFRAFVTGGDRAPGVVTPSSMLGRFRERELRQMHETLGTAAEEWARAGRSESLREYAFRHGIHHLLRCGGGSRAEALLTDFAYCMERVGRVGSAGVRGLVADYRDTSTAPGLDGPAQFGLWESFFRERWHLLRQGDEAWPSHKILLQLAVEHADDSPLTEGAEEWLRDGRCDWLWLRRARRRPTAAPSRCRLVLQGHETIVSGVEQLPDGRLLSWSADKTLRIWSPELGEPLATLRGHTGFVSGAKVLPDGRIVSWSGYPGDPTLRIWDGETYQLSAMLAGHSAAVIGVVVLDSGRVLSRSTDGTLRSWDTASGEPRAVCRAHAAGVRGARALADGRILTWSDDGTLAVCDPGSLAVEVRFEGHADELRGAVPLADGRILSWSRDATLRLWSTDQSTALATMSGHTATIGGAMVLGDGRVLSWSRDATLRIWDPRDGSELAVLAGHANSVMGAMQLPDGRVLSRSDDGTARVWDAASGEELLVLDTDGTSVEGAIVLSDGRVLTWAYERTLQVWDTQKGEVVGTLSGHQDFVDGAIELVDGRVLSWSKDGTLRVWDMTSGDDVAQLESHTDEVEGVTRIPDGRMLSWSRDAALRLWTPDGATLGVLTGHTGTVLGAITLSDGSILSWSTDGTLRMWSSRTGAQLALFAAHTARVDGARQLSDGRILSWSGDRTLRLWDASAGTLLATLAGHSQQIFGALERSGGDILSWSGDKTLRIWTPGGASSAVLEGHTRPVEGAVALDPRRILSWSADGTLRVWDGDAGRCLLILEGHKNPVYGARVLEDGRVLSWSWDRTLRLWDVDTGETLLIVPFDAVQREHPELHAQWQIARSPGGGGGPPPPPRETTSGAWYAASGFEYAPVRQFTGIPELPAFLGRTDQPSFSIPWHSTEDWLPQTIAPDGTATFTCLNEIAFLHLYRGALRVGLADGETRGGE